MIIVQTSNLRIVYINITNHKLANKFLNSLIIRALINAIGNEFHSFTAVGKKNIINVCSSGWLQESVIMSPDGTIGKRVNYW